ncbi:hypothetical protein J4464_01375 [Candidatus Woesearchaeota archaeon]|nr:hypothetical protein [Candidatus Woesearchaeota archaeon]
MPLSTHRLSKLKEMYVAAVPGMQLKHKAMFSMKNLYLMMREWLVENGWVTYDDEKFPEKLYYHIFHQTAGEEIFIWWRCVKYPPGFENTKYFMYMLDIDFHILYMKEAETMHNNVKYKVNTGDCEVRLSGRVAFDAQGSWRKDSLLKHMHTLFTRRIYNKRIAQHRRDLYNEMYRFQEALKTYFNIATYLPQREDQTFYWDMKRPLK